VDVAIDFGSWIRKNSAEDGVIRLKSCDISYALGNRAASAQHWRRHLELRRLANELQSTGEMLLAEVEIAVREVNAAAREVGHSVEASQQISTVPLPASTLAWPPFPDTGAGLSIQSVRADSLRTGVVSTGVSRL
jgi:hypothetical protein